MPKLKVTVPHQLEQVEAERRVKDLIRQVTAQFGSMVQNLQESWSGSKGNFRFQAMGYEVSGSLEVRTTEIEVEGNLPLAAMPFKGRIEGALRDQLTRLLA